MQQVYLGPVVAPQKISFSSAWNASITTDSPWLTLSQSSGTQATPLVLNLVECEALNSVAIGVLMRGYANYKSRGGEIKLCSLGKRLKDLFTMTKLIMVFDHHDTEEQAIAAFVPES